MLLFRRLTTVIRSQTVCPDEEAAAPAAAAAAAAAAAESGNCCPSRLVFRSTQVTTERQNWVRRRIKIESVIKKLRRKYNNPVGLLLSSAWLSRISDRRYRMKILNYGSLQDLEEAA